ncbi:MAG: molybdopterin-binding protein [Pseudomonadota bacterium]
MSRPAISLGCAVLSVSAAHGDDRSGELLAARATAAGHAVVRRERVADDVEQLRRVFSDCIADPAIQVVLGSGGSGFVRRNAVPEAAAGLLEQEIKGFGRLLHQLSYAEVGSAIVHARALAGYANGTLIFCLPGAIGACALAWDCIISAQLAMPDQQYRLQQR